LEKSKAGEKWGVGQKIEEIKMKTGPSLAALLLDLYNHYKL